MMVTPRSIGIKLSAARKKKNFSQATLAQELDVSPQAVGKWERGESLADIILFNRIAELLEVDLNYFSEKWSFRLDNQEKELLPELVSLKTVHLDKKKKNNWDLSESNWVNVDFSSIKNINGSFYSSKVKKCQFTGADLSGVQMRYNNFVLCDFLNARMIKMSIHETSIAQCSLKGVNLKETEFFSSNISSCDLTKSDLTKTVFTNAELDQLNFDQVELDRSSFVKTRLTNVRFSGTLNRCSFEKCSLTKVTFHKAKFIKTFFNYNDLKRVRFIDCEADLLTYELLKHGKADLSGIRVVSV